ncbi:hypothetical protein ACVINI_001165 [Rhizobium beringeri]|jgi:hypothetical protein
MAQESLARRWPCKGLEGRGVLSPGTQRRARPLSILDFEDEFKFDRQAEGQAGDAEHDAA